MMIMLIVMKMMLPLRYPESWRGTACSLPRTGYLLPPFSSYRLRMMMMMMILTIIMCLGTWHIDPATFLDIEGGTDITESGKNDDDLKCDQNVCVLKKYEWMRVYYDNNGEINIEETISLVRIKSRSMHIANASYNINVMGRVYLDEDYLTHQKKNYSSDFLACFCHIKSSNQFFLHMFHYGHRRWLFVWMPSLTVAICKSALIKS